MTSINIVGFWSVGPQWCGRWVLTFRKKMLPQSLEWK